MSAGVMLYVSFVEILVKAFDSFEASGESEADSKLYGTLCFFGGFIVMYMVDYVVHLLDPAGGHCLCMDEDSDVFDMLGEIRHGRGPVQAHEHNAKLGAQEGFGGFFLGLLGGSNSGDEQPQEGVRTDGVELMEAGQGGQQAASFRDSKLERMGLLTALAIGLHNLPEGLATFVAASGDPAVGGALAVAIALHNIPEGLCVSVPIFYASGNRHKAFGWAFVSGFAEIVGAALGWAILSQYFSDMLYALLFGLVSGMMVYIVIYQLLPTAHRYDPADKVSSSSTVAGMAVMAISLLLFLY